MGEIHQFTKEQKIILDEIKNDSALRSQFYFTGGTALSAIYLHHRYSEDLDLFSQNKVDTQTLLIYLNTWAEKHGFTFKARFVDVVYICNLTFTNNTPLKVDFSYYPYKHIENPNLIDGLYVNSLIDIAVNKLLTISQRNEVKDFVDLYYLLEKFSVWDLQEGVQVKFNMEVEPFFLASDFLKVEDFDTLPRMIKPLTLTELKTFFREKAKEISMKSVK